jgi:uncharacterized protein YjbJ (UPF0337 family)
VSGKTDEVKGRIKEAVGAVTDNDKLRAEGRTDQAVERSNKWPSRLSTRSRRR